MDDRYVVKDAVWVVESRDYVDPGPAVTGVTDNPNELKLAWKLAEMTLRQDVELACQAAEREPTPEDEAYAEAHDRQAAEYVERLRMRGADR